MAPSQAEIFSVTFFTSLETSAFRNRFTKGFRPKNSTLRGYGNELDLFSLCKARTSENEALKTSSNVPHLMLSREIYRFCNLCVSFLSFAAKLFVTHKFYEATRDNK